MAKDFKNKIGNKRLDSLIPPEGQKQALKEESVPQRATINQSSSSPIKEATPKTTVATFRVNTSKLNQLKAVAYWDRKKIQDVLDEALEAYLGSIPPTNLKKAVEEYQQSAKR